MQIHIVAVGGRVPAWANSGFDEYAKRMPGHCRVRLHEVPAGRRTKGSAIARLIDQECKRLIALTPKGCQTIALERTGQRIDTELLAVALRSWLNDGQDIAFWIGGPEGLAPDCIEHADKVWSLSALTFAHPLVRVLVAEQLYRAWSIVHGHPYHRG
ncbi:MAG: 23S rRNA (pseudouridine(1915)-N(3))-methyltransferase RlmH [Acidiferrobacterales bacterium]